MPDLANFDVWIWNSAHPERPSRSRPNTRTPSTFPRRRQKADKSPSSSPYLSTSFSSSLSFAVSSPKYDRTFLRKQKLGTHNPTNTAPTSSRSLFLQQLESFSTGEILYALITLGLTQDLGDSLIQHGGLLPDVYMLSPLSMNPLKQAHRICGYAHTVEMTHPTDDTPQLMYAQPFLETASNESIIVASLPSNTESAAWDKSLTLEVRKRGVRGTIISGSATDLVAHREAGFPLFAQGYSPPGQATAALPSRIGVPVIFSPRSHLGSHFKDSLSAVKVLPGDIIVADVGGAVCVPFELAEEVINLCRSPARLAPTLTREF